MNEVQVFHKSVYGNTLVYPANTQAKLFAKLAGTKTFNPAQLATIKQMGFAIVRVFEDEVAP